MCGIVGYVGTGDALRVVIDGLHRLEYRGYDSAGVAYLGDGGLTTIRTAGRVAELEAKVAAEMSGNPVIGHTRWATHGAPLEKNSHPHRDPQNTVAIVHNGIIDNYLALREECEAMGNEFASDTDSEVIAHLIAAVYEKSKNLVTAVETVIARLDGMFALGVIAHDAPGLLVGARRGSPLAVGHAEGAAILASDAVPILPFTRQITFLEDEQVVVMRDGAITIRENGQEVAPEITEVTWSPEAAEKGGYKHFMLKEIFEQPAALENMVRSRISLPSDSHLPPEFDMEGVDFSEADYKNISRIVLVCQGTSYHAAMVARNMIERVARIPTYPEYAADFRYRDPILDPSVLVIAFSQSGETMDTLHAVRLARENNCKVLAIVNAVGSTLAREADGVFYMHCGPEIGVASTKAFTGMIAAGYIVALRMGQARGTIDTADLRRRTENLLQLGPRVEEALADKDAIREIALRYKDQTNFLFLGRGTGWALAMEGALKLKEVSYIHAEGYDAAEMKHGPIALIDENMPALVIALKGRRYNKVIGNIQEVKARKGRVIAIASRGDAAIKELVDDVITVRDDSGIMNSIVCTAPLQLLAYYIADARGCDVDKPKNLAKSVTVE